jgi:vacuolar protein sorting-associated protein 13A/C
MSSQQLMATILEHYKSGIMSNLYTVVLELDALGNPYKLLTGIGTGLSALVEEPFQVNSPLHPPSLFVP